MKHVICILFSVLLIAGTCTAETDIGVNDLPKSDYARWLSEKDRLWADEIARIEPFAPARVRPLKRKLERIRDHATQLREGPNFVENEHLLSVTHRLVFTLERDLEGLYADLERASGPVIVLNL